MVKLKFKISLSNWNIGVKNVNFIILGNTYFNVLLTQNSFFFTSLKKIVNLMTFENFTVNVIRR